MQLSLFSSTEIGGSTETRRGPLDPTSEEALARFRTARVAAGAGARSIARDVSQLRALVRVSRELSGPSTLSALFADLPRVAQLLSTTTTPISRSTGHARLLAAQQYLRFAIIDSGQDVARAMVALDRLLPARPAVGWHATGIVVAGTAARRRPQAPTLGPADLERLVVAAGEGKGSERALRDHALVALVCYSGVRAEELSRLRWDDIGHVIVPPGRVSLAINVLRGDQQMQLPVLGPAVEALDALATAHGSSRATLSGPVFRPMGRAEQTLSYRAAREVLRAACREAGLPCVESSDLRAACANWLRIGGLKDHEVAAALGLRRVSSIDRLLRRHAALDAQRLAREVIHR